MAIPKLLWGAVVHPAAIHPLTPGSPAYALLKVGAIGSIFALRLALARRGREGAPPEREPEAIRSPHPVSKKRKRKRRRG
jgi:hypothetical protein